MAPLMTGELFLDQVRQARSLDMGILTMPQYEEPRMSNAEANEAPWDVFRSRMRPLACVTIPHHDVELLLCSKSIAWGVADANIFAGAMNRQIHEISDLDTKEGQSFLDINFSLAKALMDRGVSLATQINIGFNPQDLSAGHHSLLRLHSHVRSTSESMDTQRRQRYQWSELDRFDRLAFIEPFASLYHDYVRYQIEDCGLFADIRLGPVSQRLGYSTVPLRADNELFAIFADLKRLYVGMKREYETIQGIYTDGSRDPGLDRFMPFPEVERRQRVEAYLAAQAVGISSASEQKLRYLAAHLVPASRRDPGNPRDMASPSRMYISRGFSGAMTFRFEEDVVWLDILPRVITTSGVTKTIMGERLPTVIAKTRSVATSKERAVATQYHQHLLDILSDTIPADRLRLGCNA